MTNAELIICCSTVSSDVCYRDECPYKMACLAFKLANSEKLPPSTLGSFIKQLKPDWLMADIDMERIK